MSVSNLPGAPTGGWTARVWRLVIPIVLSNLSTPLIGAVDTAVIGRLPDPAYIGGVAIGALIFSFLYWGFGFLRMGTTGFAAQAHGAGDRAELRATLLRPLILAAGLGGLLILLQTPLALAAFSLLTASDQVEALAHAYYEVRIWSAPAALANYALVGWLLGTQRAQTALVLQLVLNGANVAFDLLFVIGFGWGIVGVALASVLAEYGAAALGLAVAFRILVRTGGDGMGLDPAGREGRTQARLWRRERLVALFRVNGDIFVRTICLIFAFGYFTAQGARMGDVPLAANAILMHLQQFISYGLDGFAHAAEILTGGAVGARSRQAFRSAAQASTIWALGAAAAMAGVYALLGPGIVGLFTGIDEVRQAAMLYLPWLVLSPLVSVWSFQLDGIFIGATRTAEMRNAMIFSLAVFLLACWVLIPLLGNHGLWLAFTLFMLVRAMSLGAFYPRLERSLA